MTTRPQEVTPDDGAPGSVAPPPAGTGDVGLPPSGQERPADRTPGRSELRFVSLLTHRGSLRPPDELSLARRGNRPRRRLPRVVSPRPSPPSGLLPLERPVAAPRLFRTPALSKRRVPPAPASRNPGLPRDLLPGVTAPSLGAPAAGPPSPAPSARGGTRSTASTARRPPPGAREPRSHAEGADTPTRGSRLCSHAAE